MKGAGWLFWAAYAAAAGGIAVACANDGDTPPEAAATGADGAADSTVETGDGGDACTDCAFFSRPCEDDIPCIGGPFDPSTVGGALDIRTQVNVVRGRSANDVWAAGALGALAHFDGTGWTRSDPGTQESMRGLWLRGSGEVAFLRIESLFTNGVVGLDAGADASVSDGGWKHGAPATYAPSYDSASQNFQFAWAPTDAEWLWIATRYGSNVPTSGLWRLRVANGNFELAEGLSADTFTSEMQSIHGISADDLWAVGVGGAAVHITGAQGATPTFATFNTQTWNALSGVWAASDTDVWAVGAEGTIRHYTGENGIWDVVTNVPTTLDLNAIYGSSSSDIWAVGNAGVVLHYDGKTWSRMNVAGLGDRRPDLGTVWMPAPGHVWIGGHGVVLSLGGKP